MTVQGAFSAGVRRVQRAPAVIAGLWLTTFLTAWPLALALRAALAENLGDSLAADTAATGMNHDWWNEFLAQAGGLGQTFVPAILGFAAVLKNISSITDAQGLPTIVSGVIAGHLVFSIFLLGGVLDRLARDRRVGTYAFFAACGTYFFRFVRLFLLAGAVYWFLFSTLHPYLFDTVFRSVTRDLTVERTAIVYRALLYLAFGICLTFVNVLFDYAKIRMVVEDRRSALGAITSAARFIWRHPRPVSGLYALNTLMFFVLLAVYALVAPGAAGGLAAWVGLLIGQLYITLRIAARLVFAASQLALFQSRLAHATYVAAPVATWPDSPAAEAISPQ